MHPAPLDKALELLKSGRGGEAERFLLEIVDRARTRFGVDSAEHAAALWDLSGLFIAVNDFDQAAETLRQSVNLSVPGEQGRRDRLTGLMNLGEILQHAGRVEEAERVLRESLVERREFYGPDHAGYAYGLEALASFVWQHGGQQEAVDLVGEAVDIFWRESNPQVASALALRAFVYRSTGYPKSVFSDLDSAPDDVVDAIVDATLRRANDANNELAISILGELAEWLGARRGLNHASLLHIYAAIGNTARLMGDHETRIEALERVQTVADHNNNVHDSIKTDLALALALGEAGRHTDAERLYRRGFDRASETGDRKMCSSVLRNLGLYLAEQNRRDEAYAVLQQAVLEGQTGSDPEATGRAMIALGIFRQHDGHLDQARELLEQALAILPVAQPDTLYARSHLDAILTNKSCGCGNMAKALTEALHGLVLPHAPPNLIARLEMDADMKIEVELSREPSEEEIEVLNRLINHAVRHLQQQIDNSGYM